MRLYRFLFLLMFFAACADKPKKNILPPDKMEDVLWDIMRADEFAINYLGRDTSKALKEEQLKFYEEIFKLHKTTQQRFESSLGYYQNHPEKLKPVMDSLETRLNRESAAQNNTVPDSVKHRQLKQMKAQ